MKTRAVRDRIHSLEIPLHGLSLLLPSAAVAEVTNPPDRLCPVPSAPAWLLGVFGWRQQPVPVVSFEVLLGQPPKPATAGSRIVVLYPVRGPRDNEFFGLLSMAEPRPQPITEGAVEAEDSDKLPDTPFVAAGIKLKERVLLIPDFDALRRAFYP